MNSFPHTQSTNLQMQWMHDFAAQNCLLDATVSLDSATAGTAMTVIPREEIPPGYKLKIVDFRAFRNGSTAIDASAVYSAMTESGTPVFSIDAAALNTGTPVTIGQSGVTVSDEFARGEPVPDVDEGLVFSAAANTTGSPVVLIVFYRFSR